jgi:DinB superfamily
MANAPEVWLRGPIPDVPALLQPVAHSLLQSREELHATLAGLLPGDVWITPGGAASVGFHARHAAGSLDRLFTYARGEQLNAAQKAALAAEGQPDLRPQVVAGLLAEFDAAVERALAQLRTTDESTLNQACGVGRGQLPSTVVGLLFHAAEHTQRHMGQLMTTARVIQGNR